jgi:hypothetical protein
MTSRMSYMISRGSSRSTDNSSARWRQPRQAVVTPGAVDCLCRGDVPTSFSFVLCSAFARIVGGIPTAAVVQATILGNETSEPEGERHEQRCHCDDEHGSRAFGHGQYSELRALGRNSFTIAEQESLGFADPASRPAWFAFWSASEASFESSFTCWSVHSRASLITSAVLAPAEPRCAAWQLAFAWKYLSAPMVFA